MTTIITAYDKNFGIGLGSLMPWSFKADMRHFANTTMNNVVIAGRTTAEKIFPLKNRICIMLSSLGSHVSYIDCGPFGYYYRAPNIELALKLARSFVSDIFVIGGSKTYKQFLDLGLVRSIIATEIDAEFIVDSYFPIRPRYGADWRVAEESPLYGDIVDKQALSRTTTCAKVVRYERT